jgi:hypothetical protein
MVARTHPTEPTVTGLGPEQAEQPPATSPLDVMNKRLDGINAVLRAVLAQIERISARLDVIGGKPQT